MKYTLNEMQIMNLADHYTLLWGFLGRSVLEQCGEKGERALREGTRRFGRDRAEALRARHLDANVKINMHSLFAVGADLPPDPRFKRELQELNPQAVLPDGRPVEGIWGNGNRTYLLRGIPSGLLRTLCIWIHESKSGEDTDSAGR